MFRYRLGSKWYFIIESLSKELKIKSVVFANLLVALFVFENAIWGSVANPEDDRKREVNLDGVDGDGDFSRGRLFDVATRLDVGSEFVVTEARFAGHQESSSSATFLAGGRVLVTGGGDGGVLLWDVTGRVENGKFATAELSPPSLEGEWGDLVADDREAAEIVGVDSSAVNIGAFALSTGLAGLAGTVLVTYFPVSPSVGLSVMPIIIIATTIGGLGSIGGTFLGGIFCGIIQQMTALLWNSALQDVPLYFLLLVFIALRPTGLFGGRAD